MIQKLGIDHGNFFVFFEQIIENKNFDNCRPGASYIGLLNDMGMGQSEFMWSVRGNPNIKKVFSQIWNSDELLVSFDGAGCFRNWHFNPQWRTLDTWYHCDQVNDVQRT